jgi:hypothetical protein
VTAAAAISTAIAAGSGTAAGPDGFAVAVATSADVDELTVWLLNAFSINGSPIRQWFRRS